MNFKNLLPKVAAAFVALAVTVALAPAAAAATGSRYGGSDRYDTAARIVTAATAHEPVVILANGENRTQGIDALAANYLAGKHQGSLVLVSRTSATLDTADAVASELTGYPASFKPTVYVMGSTQSVSDAAVKAALKFAPKNTVIKRIAGSDRYATAALIARAGGAVKLYALASPDAPHDQGEAPTTTGKTAFLASGESNADALAAGPISYWVGIPVLLTGKKTLAAPTAKAIKDLGITQLIVLGGTDRIPDAVVEQGRAAGVTVDYRIAGKDRYETAAQLSTYVASLVKRNEGFRPMRVIVANGATGFPDALAAGQFAEYVLTVPGKTVPKATLDAMRELNPDFVIAAGSTAAVSDGVLNALVKVTTDAGTSSMFVGG